MVTAVPPSEANSAEAIFTSDGKIEVNKLSALSRLSDGIVGIVGSFCDLMLCNDGSVVVMKSRNVVQNETDQLGQNHQIPPKSDTDVTTMSSD